MRRVTAMLSVAAVVLMAVVLMAGGLSAQTKPNFAGEWKVVAANGQGEPGVDLIITQSETATTVENKRDGRVSKATWAGNTIVVTAATPAGEEKRTFSMDGDTLMVDVAAPSRKGGAPTITRETYRRYQKGYGG